MRANLAKLRTAADMAVIKTRCRLFSAAGVAGATLLDSVCVLADEKTGDADAKTDTTFDFLTSGTSKNASIDSATTAIKGLGFSFYQLLMVLGIVCTVCSLIWTGVCIAMVKNAGKRDENKSHLLYIAVAAVIIFGAITLVGAVKTFSESITL